jgi:hypothetical protein
MSGIVLSSQSKMKESALDVVVVEVVVEEEEEEEDDDEEVDVVLSCSDGSSGGQVLIARHSLLLKNLLQHPSEVSYSCIAAISGLFHASG